MKNMYRLKRFWFAASCFIMLHVTFTRASVHQPFLQIPEVKTPPVIDGRIDDAAWKSSAQQSEFVIWTLDTYVKDSLQVFLCHDGTNLYVAFRNADISASRLKKPDDPKGTWDTFLWGRNFNSVQLGHGDAYFNLMADPKGTQTDYKDGDISWNGTWKFAASVNPTNWTSEFSIPLQEYGISASAGNVEMTIGFSRSFPTGESASWSGQCILAGPAGADCRFGRWPGPVPGKNHIPLTLRNNGDQPLTLTCELELFILNKEPEFIRQEGQGSSSDLQLSVEKKPLVYTYSFTIPAGTTLQEKVMYELPEEGSYYASALIRNTDGKLIHHNGDFWFTIEPNKGRLKEIQARLGESTATLTRVFNPVADQLRNEAEALQGDLDQLSAFAETSWKTGGWNEVTRRVKETDAAVTRFLHKVKWTALHNWKSGNDFAVAAAHSAVKLRRDALFPLPIRVQLELSLARNEYESVQLAILPFGKDITGLYLEASDLKGENGSVIERKNIEISLVDYHWIDWQAAYVTQYKGWHPDPLIPVTAPVNVSGSDVCRPFWITVYAPPGTAAGNYSGTISVGAPGTKTVTVPVQCRVWNFDIPVSGHLKTHTWDDLDNLSDFYNLETYPVDWYLKFCDILLKNRMNPGFAGVNYLSQTPDRKGNYNFTQVEKVLDYCMERGLNRFSIIQMKKGEYTPQEAESAYRFVTAYARFLRQKGWLDKALVELWDEPTDLEWPGIKERAERLKKIDQGLRLQLFAEGGPYDFWDKSTDKYGLNNLVDIWAPIYPVESPETQARGGEIWAYFCTLARESAPNFYIDCPAVYQRSIAWYCWMYGLDGFEHWSTTYFWRNTLRGKPMDQKWPNVPWDARTYHNFNGEGHLVYPGRDGATYSSIRLENFREGMEDYEYLYRLKELLDLKDKAAEDARLDEYRQLLQPESYLLYKYPKKIKHTLENTLRYPDRPEFIIETRDRIAEAIEALQ